MHAGERYGGALRRESARTGERLDEDLHATAEAEHEVEGALLLDVVVGKGAAVLELLAREDQALLVGGNA